MAVKASRKAYFSDVNGTLFIDFQFSPAELDMGESSVFKVENLTGKFGPNIMWSSGSIDPINLEIFIDRTQESFVGTKIPEEKKTIKTPGLYPNPLQTSAIVQAVRRMYLKRAKDTVIEQSSYDMSPGFEQSKTKYNGVLTDLANIQKFVRPEGYEESISGMLVPSYNYKGTFTVTESPIQRFTTPPVIRFFYGDIWLEGYISKFKYKLSVPNTNLIPQRLQGDITLIVHRGGQFKSISSNASLYSKNNVILS